MSTTATRERQEIVVEATPQLPAARNDAESLMTVISRAASDPTVNIDKLERLMAMHETITTRQAEQAFNEAMTAAQSEMRRIATDSDNPQTRSRYASYAALDRSIRPIYTKHGLVPSFNTGEGATDGYVRVVCDVSKGGFTRRYHIDMPADGKGAKGGDVMTKTHATGSAITYGRRYLLTMIFNLAVGQDNDGNSAGDDQEKLSADDVANLRDMLAAKSAPEDKFLKWAKVARLEDIPAARYDACVHAIQNYKGGAK